MRNVPTCLACISWCLLSSYCLAFVGATASSLQHQKQLPALQRLRLNRHSNFRKLAAPLTARDVDDGDDFEDDFEEEERSRSSRRKRQRKSYDSDNYDEYDDDALPPKKVWGLTRKKGGFLDSIPKALLAGIFVLGIGTGVTVDSAINTDPRDLASRDAIDRNAPNPGICQTYGASAMVVDQRVFVTFNPFSIYVSQADVKPGCVLRQANFQQVLQRRGLITDAEVQTCKGGMNTWAYVGDLNGKPQLSCVYQSDDAQNEFVSDPRIGLGEDVYDDERAVEQALAKGTAPSATSSKQVKAVK